MIAQMATDIGFVGKHLSILERKTSKHHLTLFKDYTNFFCFFETKKELRSNVYKSGPEEIGVWGSAESIFPLPPCLPQNHSLSCENMLWLTRCYPVDKVPNPWLFPQTIGH